MSSLPLKLPWNMAENRWATAIEPVLNSPIAQPVILKNVALAAGTNVINHLLGRKLVGWNPTRVRASATFFDLQDTNQTPQLTLVLVASAPVTIDIMVY